MHKINFFLIGFFLVVGCGKEEDIDIPLNEQFVEFSSHQLMTFSTQNNSEYLIVFESGLGDDHQVWTRNSFIEKANKMMDILIYDRGGYGQSTINNNPRNIEQLNFELESIVAQHAGNRKVILVGHSLGGMIIRDYAIKNPTKTAALLFIDASHELYNNPSQEEENLIYNAFQDAFGENSGAAREARELIENSQYMESLSNLPDIPVIAISSMKIDNNHDQQDRDLWFQSKEKLKEGVADFEHVTTTKSGHYIMLEEPELVLNNLSQLIAKL